MESLNLNWARLRKNLLIALVAQVVAEVVKSRREAAAS